MPLVMQPACPVEIILLITRFLIWDHSAQSNFETVHIPTKARFSPDFPLTCRIFHRVFMSEWFYLFRMISPRDWLLAQEKGIAHHIRILIVQESALISHAAPKLNLSQMGNIQIVTLDCHNDVGCSSTNKGQWSYKKVMPRLPRSLKSLVVLNAHGPDLQVIQQAVEQCPELEDLCLGRCTKFNRQDNCEFWKKFPDDHDSYFSNKGIEGYSKALGTELRRLKRLKSIYVNVYLTDTKYLHVKEADLAGAHEILAATFQQEQEQTTPKSNDDLNRLEIPPPAPHTVASPQVEHNQPVSSHEDDEKQTRSAEISASHTLFECHSELCRVAFVSYWSPNHLGWSSHSRDSCADCPQVPPAVPQPLYIAPDDTGGHRACSPDALTAQPDERM